MKKQRIGKYRLFSVGIMLLMFLLFWTNVSSGKSFTKVIVPSVLFLIGAGLFLFGPQIEKREKKKERSEGLKEEFPEFVRKISMLIQAGFSPKGSFERVAKSYLQKKKREKYSSLLMEEVLVTLREMESGVSEITAYEHFASRCEMMEAIRFSGLMIRDIKRGSSNLSEELKEESQRAVNAQKEIIRKKGEVAGTKLLFPMMLFLLIVMVIILYPAFTTIVSMKV